MQARNPAFTEATQKQVQELAELGWYHSIALPGGEVIPGLQSIEQLQSRIARFPIPENLAGKRVLDIGAWDGWFSFEMERRGAEVLAVDSFRQDRFLRAKELLGSRVEYRVEDVCRLHPDKIGYFDYVLFFGVLYHVKHPLLALENVCRLTRESAFVESYVTDDGSDLSAPTLMEFYETTELRGQFDNWVGPNTSCLLAFCRTAGFARVLFESVDNNRAHVTCHRQWADPRPANESISIVAVENSVTRRNAFDPDADEYATFWFKADQPDLRGDTVFPRVGQFGSPPVHLAATGEDGWMVNFKLPLGLLPGEQIGTVSTLSATSNPVRLRIGESINPANQPTRPPVIEIVTDGVTWERNLVRMQPHGTTLSLWARHLPDGLSTSDVMVRLDEKPLAVVFCSALQSDGLTQINATLPSSWNQTRLVAVRLCVGAFESEAVPVEVLSSDKL